MAWNRLALWVGTGKAPYVIAEQETDGTLACSCWPWRKERDCKHLRAIRSLVAEGGSDPRLTVLNPSELKRVVEADVAYDAHA